MSVNREYNYTSFADTLLEFTKYLIVKNETRAKEYETKESLENATRYIMAYECTDKFNSYSDWTRAELERAEVDPSIIDDILDGNIEVPEEYRNRLLRNRRELITQTYVEYNNYYRMLNGQPNYGEEGVMTSFGKPTTELNPDELFHLQQGELDELIIKYPDKEYLKHLSKDGMIDIYSARKAKNYEILGYRKYILEEAQAAKFQELYYQSRQYVLIANYSKAFTRMYYYDAMIIILILFLTMQKYINETYNYAIRKDFYNMDDIKNTFLSYGLPFFSEIPIKYQRNIVKNLNHLLKYKGTDKCLVDIVKLFGFHNVELYKYFLIKDFKRDIDGNPDITPSSRELTYELKWAQVPFETTDITEALQQTTLYQNYELVANDDPFWGEYYSDDTYENMQKFKEELLNLEFNYINTKYLAVNTMYNVTQNTLDTAYFFNLINTLQVNNGLAKLTFISKEIKPSGNVIRLFDAITAVYYLICKKLGYEDNIVKTSTATASIYDFKFNQDMNTLLNSIEHKVQVKIDDESIRYSKHYLHSQDVRNMVLENRYYTNEELVELYFKNIDYRNFLIERMNATDDYLEYKTLSDIYNYNMTAESVTNAYGSYTTYKDYLMDADSELFTYVNDNSQNDNAINLTISNILYAIESNLNSSRFDDVFSSLSSLSGDIVKQYIMKMINIFKAYTVELKRINIYYIFDYKWMNRIKLLSFMYTKVESELADSMVSDLLEEFDTFEKIVERMSSFKYQSEFTMLTFKYVMDKIRYILESEFNVHLYLADSFQEGYCEEVEGLTEEEVNE